MFAKEKNQATQAIETDPNSRNQIAAGTTLVGEVKSDGVFRMDGTLTGNLTTKGKLVVGPTGRIDGEITVKSAEILGEVNGKIYVEEQLVLRATAKVTGEVYTAKLSIEAGATFSVQCDMTGGKTSPMQKNAKPAEKEATR